MTGKISRRGLAGTQCWHLGHRTMPVRRLVPGPTVTPPEIYALTRTVNVVRCGDAWAGSSSHFAATVSQCDQHVFQELVGTRFGAIAAAGLSGT